VVGDDVFGRFMLGEMALRGIDVSACTVDPIRPTGATVILTSGTDRAILTAMGSIGALDVDAVPPALVGRARHLHSACFYLQETTAAAAGLLRRGAALWPDDVVRHELGPERAMGRWCADMLQAADVFFPSATEARRIAHLDDVEEQRRPSRRQARSGRTDGGPIVAEKLSCRRCSRLSGRQPDRRVEACQSRWWTTGAGDSFNAGFLRAWLGGGDLRECLELGAVCGALSARETGGVDGGRLAEARKPSLWVGEDVTGIGRRLDTCLRRGEPVDRSAYEVDRLGAGTSTDAIDRWVPGDRARAARAAASSAASRRGDVAGRAGDWIVSRLAALPSRRMARSAARRGPLSFLDRSAA
jgi:sugar/nucleoside kinase (ribokinase family)